MRKMGKYCKAYPIQRFRQFSAWKENAENIRKETKQVDGKESEAGRELTDADYLYLQEDFTVTDGIFLEENVIFDDVSPEWKEFCVQTLKFEVPNYDVATTGEAAAQTSA
jgi:hypothetical protein